MKRKILAGVAAVVVFAILIVGIRGCMKAGETDAASYVQAQLDLMFQGETQEAQEILGASKKEWEQVYENGIQAFITSYLMDGSEDLSAAADAFGPTVKAIFRLARYQVGSVSDGGGKERTVTVTYEPMDVFTQFVPRLREMAKDIEAAARMGTYTGTEEEKAQAMLMEYLTKSVSLLEDCYRNLQYGEKQEYTFTVSYEKAGNPTLKNAEITEFMEKILELDKL